MTFKQYEKVIADWAAVKVASINEALFTGKKPKDFKTPYFPMLLDRFKSVSDSFEAMKFSLTLLESEFPASSRIKKEQYLEYIVHAFYSDCYVLKELLKGYANQIQKVYIKKLVDVPVKSTLEPIFKALSNDIEVLMDIRNAHVHQDRFKGGGLSDLSGLALLAQYDSSLSAISDEAFEIVLQTWRDYMSRIIELYTWLLDDAFDCIAKVVVENGVVREP
ncbi:hypothetical protein [Vibrio injensis]|uniref:hypothetical protein n=1 Tax=Vibrio injensis TaxID=1307414 RepID=UPI00278BB326|nr:hypothetical protein [Vibrio injensis]